MTNKKSFKIALSLVLALVVLGMVFLAVFGVNKTIDYKDGYEVIVGVDQKVGNSETIVKNTAEKFFSEKNVKPVSYSIQKMGEGASFVFKFNGELSIDQAELCTAVQNAIDADSSIENIQASATISKVYFGNQNQIGNIVFAILIVSILAFFYIFFTEKLATALTCLFNAFIASLMCVSLLSVVRIPTNALLGIFVMASFALSFAISSGILYRCKEIVKLQEGEKPSFGNVVEQSIKLSANKLIFVGLSSVVVGLVIAIVGYASLLFIGLQIIVAVISSIISSILFTPIIWPTLKGLKN